MGHWLVQRRDKTGLGKYSLYLHDLSETTLADNLEQLEVFYLERPLPVFDKLDTTLDRAGSVLKLNPFRTRLALSLCLFGVSESGLFSVLSAQLGVFLVGVDFLKARVDSAGSQEDVVVSASVGRSVGVSDVDGQVQVASARHIELVLGVFASPNGLLWCARYRVYEDLLLVEINESVGQILGGVATVDRGGGIDASLRGLWTSRGI